MAAILCGVSLSALSQVTSGSIAGVVKDAQGGVVPGATVILVSETQGTKSIPVVTGPEGNFVFPNVSADSYAVEISMNGFKTLRRIGVNLSPGDRLSLGALSIEVGGTAEMVDVSADRRDIQSASGERSFTVAAEQIQNLPLASRSFQAFATLTPGVDGTTRIGGGGGTNFMMDGVVTMDPGSGGPALQVSTESIAEIKILTSGYQPEYGRASGLQITAVTKSGSNRFHGSFYDVERNSNWNTNTKVNQLNGDPKTISRERDWGWSVGGPVGKPGGRNRLFFFYAQEFNPRKAGNNVVRFRMPTALERKGDFSQSYDNNGVIYPYVKDPLLPSECSAASQASCFRDGGVLGRIPSSRLYSTGLAILNWWPLPNIDGNGLPYNYELTRPTENALGYQPVIRIDYQPSTALRLTGKYAAYAQRNQVFLGVLPGFTETLQSKPITPTMLLSAAYTVNATTFIDGTWGHTTEQQEGCAFTGTGGSPGPTFCTAAIAQSPLSNYKAAGFGDLPLVFPDATMINPAYHAFDIMQQMSPPFWDGTRLLRAPTFTFGNRIAAANAPPGTPFPPFFQSGGTHDVSISLAKVLGRHTVKTGYYFQSELHTRNGGASAFGTLSFQNDTVGTNPFDTSFGYANAAIGSYSAYTQNSKYLEGRFVYFQNEAYIQDNWRVRERLTLDYGVRFVNQRPYYDQLRQGSNFLPQRWDSSAAPVLYVAACADGVYPCSGNSRQAMNPLTGRLLGANSTLAIGTLVPNSGSTANALFLAGQGISDRTFEWPVLAVAPRLGLAYDVRGSQQLVLRGSAGLFYDRPSANAAGTYNAIGNPPISQAVTYRYGQLQTLANLGLATTAPSALRVIDYKSPLPASVQWNGGIQMSLPLGTSLDVSYVGQHSYNTLQTMNLNSIDLGTAFLASTQDPSTAVSGIPGAASYASTSPDLLRSFRGYGAIIQSIGNGWRTYHSIQFSLQRRLQNGFSFGFNDTIGLYDRQNSPPRLEHPALGAYQYRADQAMADALLGNNYPQAHVMRANVVWDLPDLRADRPVARVFGLLLNDWQLSSIWSASTSISYAASVSYQSGAVVNVTGSPEFAPRVAIVGDTGHGCSADPYRQFNTAALRAPAIGSVGLESSTGYLRGCFQSSLDLALARNIRLGGGRSVQLRLDMFNVPNQAAVTGRNTTMNVNSPTDATVANLPFDAAGNLIPSRAFPRGAGFGVATGYQSPRAVQVQARFSF